MFRFIRSFGVAAISLLALGLPMVVPSPSRAAPTGSIAPDAPYSTATSGGNDGGSVDITWTDSSVELDGKIRCFDD